MSRKYTQSGDAWTLSMKSTEAGGLQPYFVAPKKLDARRMDCISFASGIHLVFEDFFPDDHVTAPFMFDSNPFFFFGFMLQGSASHSIRGQNRKTMKEYVGPVSALFKFSGDGMCHYEAGRPAQFLTVMLNQESMHQVLGDGIAMLPKKYRLGSARSDMAALEMAAPMTASMRVAAHQAFRQAGSSEYDFLLLESKALELLVHFLGELSQNAGHPHRITPAITPDKREKIHAAKAILEAEYEEPPSIAALAQRVGMNTCTLKNLFKACFGMTIYTFVRRERMEQAKRLLKEGMSVIQVSSHVGYVNSSNFANVFRRYHGVSPSKFRRRP